VRQRGAARLNSSLLRILPLLASLPRCIASIRHPPLFEIRLPVPGALHRELATMIVPECIVCCAAGGESAGFIQVKSILCRNSCQQSLRTNDDTLASRLQIYPVLLA
jgi:hypothetical protein